MAHKELFEELKNKINNNEYIEAHNLIKENEDEFAVIYDKYFAENDSDKFEDLLCEIKCKAIEQSFENAKNEDKIDIKKTLEERIATGDYI